METALTLPLLLLVSVGIFEFGRAYQTWQILTNAAREGARIAVLPNSQTSDVQTRVVAYLRAGQLAGCDTSCVVVTPTTISIGAANAAGSRVTVNYPFQFIVLQPVAQLVQSNSSLGAGTITLSASAEMRNEQ